MRICVLVQTAKDISLYYKTFFKDYDIFFITFKEKNQNAIDFLPKSSWSDGRNRLWDYVKGKYDYYMFIDDDLKFMKLRFKSFFLNKLYMRVTGKQVHESYVESTSEHFFETLENVIQVYSPEILSVTDLAPWNEANLDYDAIKKKSSVRRLGWFDAQFTIFSNYAALSMLPYDTSVSGWWSAQVPIYLSSYYIFASKAISSVNLGVANSFHSGEYVPNYSGIQDCKKMVSIINKITEQNFDFIIHDSDGVKKSFQAEAIMNTLPKVGEKEDYRKNYNSYLKGLSQLLPSLNNL